jgi:hypothetical protein
LARSIARTGRTLFDDEVRNFIKDELSGGCTSISFAKFPSIIASSLCANDFILLYSSINFIVGYDILIYSPLLFFF